MAAAAAGAEEGETNLRGENLTGEFYRSLIKERAHLCHARDFRCSN